MKILYIAKRGENNIAAKTHLKVIKELYGENNVYEIDLLEKNYNEKKNYIAFGYNSKNIGERLIRFVEGNSPFISNKIINKVCHIIQKEKIELVFSEESDLGNLYKKIKIKFQDVKIICFFHDISADLFRKRIEDAPKWKKHYILECKNIIAQEKITQKYVDKRWVFNEADAERFVKNYGYFPDEIIPMGAPRPIYNSSYQNIVTNAESKKNILFVCSSYYVNIEGFIWFYNNVLPYLHKKYDLFVVGSGSKQLEGKIRNENVKILGRVESMTSYYENADIVIEPVFDGGGMKVKTIEAISFGKYLISTSESLNGYWEKIPENLKNEVIFRCNTKQEWIDACNFLLNTKIKKYNEDIFDTFSKYFSAEALKKQFFNAFKH